MPNMCPKSAIVLLMMLVNELLYLTHRRYLFSVLLGLFFQLQKIRSQYLEQITENILFQFLISIYSSIYNLASSHFAFVPINIFKKRHPTF